MVDFDVWYADWVNYTVNDTLGNTQAANNQTIALLLLGVIIVLILIRRRR
jgi:hypothetical protein